MKLLMSSVLGLSACSRGKSPPETINHLPETENSLNKRRTLTIAWQKLIFEKGGSIPLADLFSSMIRKEDSVFFENINTSDLQMKNFEATKKITREIQELKSHFLLGNSELEFDKELINNLLISEKYTGTILVTGFAHQAEIKTASELQKKSLDSILEAFNKSAKTKAKVQAATVIKDLPEHAIQELDLLKKNPDRKDTLNKIYTILKKWNVQFKNYSNDEIIREIMAQYLCEQIQIFIANNPSIRNIVETLNNASALTKELKNFEISIKAIRDSYLELTSNSKQFLDATQNIQSAVTKVNEQKMISLNSDFSNFVSAQLMQGVSKSDLETKIKSLEEKNQNKSNSLRFLDEKIQISRGVLNMLNATEKVANNVENVINISQKLGLKLDENLKSTVKTAQSISKGAQFAKEVASALSKGGVLGAISLFAKEGPASELLIGLGLGDSSGSDPATMNALADIKNQLLEVNSRLREIDRKIEIIDQKMNVVLETQQVMIGMIKELGLLLDSQHKQEMGALADIQKEVLINQGILSWLTTDRVRACELITSLAIKNSDMEIKTSLPNYDILVSTNYVSKFRKVFADPVGLESFFFEEGKRDWLITCYRELAETFLPRMNIQERPIAISRQFNLDSSLALKNGISEGATKYANWIHKAIENSRERLTKAQQLKTMHLPPPSISFLILKNNRIDFTAERKIATSDNFYDLDFHIFPYALERRVQQLLYLFPLIGFHHNGDLSESINHFVQQNLTTPKLGRTYLETALRFVRTAIAQESLIAGELSLDRLAKLDPTQWAEKIDGNPILARNLLLTYLYFQQLENPTFLKQYEELENSEGISTLVKLPIAPDFKTVTVGNVSNIPLPSVEEIKKGTLFYSENLPPLIRLQEQLVQALALDSLSDNYSPMEKSDLLSVLLVKAPN